MMLSQVGGILLFNCFLCMCLFCEVAISFTNLNILNWSLIISFLILENILAWRNDFLLTNVCKKHVSNKISHLENDLFLFPHRSPRLLHLVRQQHLKHWFNENHCKKYHNFTEFSGKEILRKGTVSS